MLTVLSLYLQSRGRLAGRGLADMVQSGQTVLRSVGAVLCSLVQGQHDINVWIGHSCPHPIMESSAPLLVGLAL